MSEIVEIVSLKDCFIDGELLVSDIIEAGLTKSIDNFLEVSELELEVEQHNRDSALCIAEGDIWFEAIDYDSDYSSGYQGAFEVNGYHFKGNTDLGLDEVEVIVNY